MITHPATLAGQSWMDAASIKPSFWDWVLECGLCCFVVKWESRSRAVAAMLPVRWRAAEQCQYRPPCDTDSPTLIRKLILHNAEYRFVTGVSSLRVYENEINESSSVLCDWCVLMQWLWLFLLCLLVSMFPPATISRVRSRRAKTDVTVKFCHQDASPQQLTGWPGPDTLDTRN